MIIKSITIHKFRAFRQDLHCKLGARITAICGKNKTQKSTLLGLLGQPFSIGKNSPLYGKTTIDGYNFRSQFQEKFKLSPNKEKHGDHEWTLEINKHIYEKEFYTAESIKRPGLSAGIRIWKKKDRSKGSGYIQCPVFYMSLSRLSPIGESKSKLNPISNLSFDEIKEYTEAYFKIFPDSKELINIDNVIVAKSSSIKYAGINTEQYDFITNSSGESNISKIILAVLSYKRLKNSCGKDYKGGLLLIDELDATLHTSAQINLLHYLMEASKKLKLQIVFSTHSTTLLKELIKQIISDKRESNDKPHNDKLCPDYCVINLRYDSYGDNKIYCEDITTMKGLKGVVSDLSLKEYIPDSINVYCEDLVALEFLKYTLSKHITNKNISSYYNFLDVDLSWTHYVTLLGKNIAEFKNSIICLDKDVATSAKKEQKEILKNNSNCLILPLTIEKDIFNFLNCNVNFFMDKYDQYQEIYREKTTLFKQYANRDDLETKDYKNWFEDITKIIKKEDLYEAWLEKNKATYDDFFKKFQKASEDIALKLNMDFISEWS